MQPEQQESPEHWPHHPQWPEWGWGHPSAPGSHVTHGTSRLILTSPGLIHPEYTWCDVGVLANAVLQELCPCTLSVCSFVYIFLLTGCMLEASKERDCLSWRILDFSGIKFPSSCIFSVQSYLVLICWFCFLKLKLTFRGMEGPVRGVLTFRLCPVWIPLTPVIISLVFF